MIENMDTFESTYKQEENKQYSISTRDFSSHLSHDPLFQKILKLERSFQPRVMHSLSLFFQREDRRFVPHVGNQNSEDVEF
jgi:hypothetical protein